jgi:hypothetical protein
MIEKIKKLGESQTNEQLSPRHLPTHLILLKSVEEANIQDPRQLNHHKANYVEHKALAVVEAKRRLFCLAELVVDFRLEH